MAQRPPSEVPSNVPPPRTSKDGTYASKPDASGTHSLYSIAWMHSVDGMLEAEAVRPLFDICAELGALRDWRHFFSEWSAREPWEGNGHPATFRVAPVGMGLALICDPNPGLPGVLSLGTANTDRLRKAVIQELLKARSGSRQVEDLARLYEWCRVSGGSLAIFREEWSGVRREFTPLQAVNISALTLAEGDFVFLHRAVAAAKKEMQTSEGFFSPTRALAVGGEFAEMAKTRFLTSEQLDECDSLLAALESDLFVKRTRGINAAWTTPLSSAACDNFSQIFRLASNRLFFRADPVPVWFHFPRTPSGCQDAWGYRFDGMDPEAFYAENRALSRGLCFANRMKQLAHMPVNVDP